MVNAKNSPASAPFALDLDRPIVLVGMMGVGKSTVGRRLAGRLGLDFFDADEEIEKAAGMSVADLFDAHGEEHFRRGEAQVIARLLSQPPHVLATGGGAILEPETLRLIKEKAISIWIRADVDVLLKRTMRRGGRPLLQNGDPHATLVQLLEARAPLYAQADVTIDSLPGPHMHTVEAILAAIAPLTGTERRTEQPPK